MKFKITKPLWQAVGLGAIAGSRSMLAPAVATRILSNRHSDPLEKSGLNFMQTKPAATAFKLLAASELIGDKMPFAPNRIALPGLTGRVLLGALSGASVYKASGGKAYIGAILGGSAAVLSTFGTFYLRKATVKGTHVLDPVIGAVEDALMLGAGASLVKAG